MGLMFRHCQCVYFRAYGLNASVMRRWRLLLFLLIIIVVFIVLTVRPVVFYPSSLRNGANVATKEWNEHNVVVFYNRIPKTGSTSFMGILYELCAKNGFNVVHLNISRNNHYMTMWDQVRFGQNLSNWVTRKPTVYHGHVVYIDFDRLGTKKPIFINIVRDPLERFVSYYYFLRYGDDFRPHLSRKRKGNNETFDSCVKRQGSDCDVSKMWLQVPFFCGHSADCRIPGNRWALQRAKETLLNQYLLVGLTEEMEDFLYTLELALPTIFSGSTNLLRNGHNFNLRRTKNKLLPSAQTVNVIHESDVWKIEQEFYDFARRQFHFAKAKWNPAKADTGTVTAAYHYEKVKPRF